MKDLYICCLLLLTALLMTGCSGDETIDAAFHNEMQRNNELDNYTFLQKVATSDSGVILFKSHIKSSDENELVHLGYFIKKSSEWKWVKTITCGKNWSINLEGDPAIYCGTAEPDYKDVYVGSNRAKMVEVTDNQRVWFLLHNKNNEEIKAVLTGGTEKWLKQNVK